MNTSSRYYLVAAEVLPDIFLKVAEANRLLRAGEVGTAGEAAKAAGISRSAYYKYRDAIQPFTDMTTGHIITFYALLKIAPVCCPMCSPCLPAPAPTSSPSTRASPQTAVPPSPSPRRPPA